MKIILLILAIISFFGIAGNDEERDIRLAYGFIFAFVLTIAAILEMKGY